MKRRFRHASTKWLLDLLTLHAVNPKVVRSKAIREAERELDRRGVETGLFPACTMQDRSS